MTCQAVQSQAGQTVLDATSRCSHDGLQGREGSEPWDRQIPQACIRVPTGAPARRTAQQSNTLTKFMPSPSASVQHCSGSMAKAWNCFYIGRAPPLVASWRFCRHVTHVRVVTFELGSVELVCVGTALGGLNGRTCSRFSICARSLTELLQ